ncbi:cyclin-D1-binding protein 1 homolog [Parasteatoda tepidariorum]|uniref:cyclin-D1-binding protein 1 homolog n=1 Tax=Parasteatoda tepidariorum TaxID=114398 RepID=UPI001C7268EB|nr:cyclin-D1-binding protein 1 homolog [Parasteatoda tepidariorum]
MADGGISTDVKNIVQNLQGTLNIACDQLTGDLPVRDCTDFENETFWANFAAATNLVSHEATKFCVAFDSGGVTSIEECQCLVNKVENACLALLSVFFKFPVSRGKTLHKEIHLHVSSILNGMKNLCSAIINQSGHLQNVGNVWADCEAVESLPKNNIEAVIKLCREQHDMVQDASQELMNAIEEEESNNGVDLTLLTPLNGLRVPINPSWTDSDRNVLFPCSGLVKAAKACIKKVQKAISQRGNGNTQNCIDELDLVADIIKSSSLIADDLVLSLYPPMNHSVVRQHALMIRDNSKEILSFAKSCHFYSIADDVWIEFLGRAIDHNWVRISDMVLAD